MVKVFLRGGADPFLRNEMGLTPLRLAEEALQSGYEDGENQYDGGCCSSSSRSNHHHNRQKIVAMLKTVIAMCGHGGHQLRLRQRQRERQQQQ